MDLVIEESKQNALEKMLSPVGKNYTTIEPTLEEIKDGTFAIQLGKLTPADMSSGMLTVKQEKPEADAELDADAESDDGAEHQRDTVNSQQDELVDKDAQIKELEEQVRQLLAAQKPAETEKTMATANEDQAESSQTSRRPVKLQTEKYIDEEV